MSIDPITIAILGAVGLIGAAGVTAIGVGFSQLWKRISDLENRVQQVAARETRLWWWARTLQDFYYRHRKADAPDLPEPPEFEITKEPT